MEEKATLPVLIYDNASIHRSKFLTTFLAEHKVDILYGPPYSPMLNSAEFANQFMKQGLKHENLSNR